MKIVFFGDSITDMHREKTVDNMIYSYGSGYPFIVASELFRINPLKHEIINRGIGGNRTVDLYARIKEDVWNLNPDLLSILIGTNDVWHESMRKAGIEIERFEKVYRLIIEETMANLPNCKIILMEPFFLKGRATNEILEDFSRIYDYAKVVKKLANEYNLPIVLLQDAFNDKANKYGPEPYLYDGVHPMVAGATLIADNWLEVFMKEFSENGNK